VVFAEAGKAGIELSHDQRLLIHAHIDSAVRESVNSFVAVQAALREQFVAAITHDLRTPLANAQMAAQLIERSAAEPEIRRLAGQVIENTRRIDGMTRELLNKIVFSADSDSSLQLSEFDLAELAHEVTRYAQGAHPIELRVQAQPLCVHWCRESIQRALENLISNATKYGEPEPPIELNVTSYGERAQLSVHNKGAPIPPEDQETIFQLYRRAASGNGHQEGWGVGLPFVRKVAESHGGSIMVASSVADGTTFVIDMPIDARPFQQAPTAA
jgi:signal transduction histidine kinase